MWLIPWVLSGSSAGDAGSWLSEPWGWQQELGTGGMDGNGRLVLLQPALEVVHEVGHVRRLDEVHAQVVGQVHPGSLAVETAVGAVDVRVEGHGHLRPRLDLGRWSGGREGDVGTEFGRCPVDKLIQRQQLRRQMLQRLRATAIAQN